jgi:hypothetical protein
MARTSYEDVQLIEYVQQRYEYALQAGHADYVDAAKENEDFYVGNGNQWSSEDKSVLEDLGLPYVEANLVKSTINTIIGNQIQSRMSVNLLPREDADQTKARMMTKLMMYILDKNRMPWVESQVFQDGLIERRGYYDIRINFDNNINGEIEIKALNPRNVIPDPDADSYDPDDWADVIVASWMRKSDIAMNYGKAKADKAAVYCPSGSDESRLYNNSFSDDQRVQYYRADPVNDNNPLLLTMERQWWEWKSKKFFVDLQTGDLLPVPEELTPKEIKRMVRDEGVDVIRKPTKVVMWSVSTKDVLLHKSESPYNHFTVVPFFPIFRRGSTVCPVDDLRPIQQMYNKVLSKLVHVLNTGSSSGWVLEANSLANMDVEELEERGSDDGLVIEHKRGTNAPAKIPPQQMPSGATELLAIAEALITKVAGVTATFMGQSQGSADISGISVNNRIQQSALSLALPMDNLFRTRHILASRILGLVQQFYTDTRLIRIDSEFTLTNPQNDGELLEYNTVNPETGEIVNDVSVGKYDIVIGDIPTRITYQEQQFASAIEMRKFGVAIPDAVMIRLSPLDNKDEIIEQLAPSDPQMEALQRQVQQLEVEKLQAELEKMKADEEQRYMQNTKTAADIAQMLLQDPAMSAQVKAIIDMNVMRANLNNPEKVEATTGIPQEPPPASGFGAVNPDEVMYADV